ncbi:MAG: glycosyltransferase [Bacteroidales bacterium]
MGINFTVNPLNPKYLDFRIMLFEMTCLPGILCQSTQNFTWIVIIDKKLPEKYKQRLKSLIKPKKRAFIWEYDPTVRIESIDWIKPYIQGNPDYLITSNLDDDDILPSNFIESSKKHVLEIEQHKKLPTLKLLGNKQIIQWDLVHTEAAPLGWRSPWHRGNFYSSCGFSLIAKYPLVEYSVLGIMHRMAEKYIDFSLRPNNKNIAFHHKRFKETFRKNNDDFRQWNKKDLLFDLSETTGPVLMTNHKFNAQYGRLYEVKPELLKVTGPETFPEFNIDWDFVIKNISRFNIDHMLYLKENITTS